MLQGGSEDSSTSHPPRLPSYTDEDDAKRESVLGNLAEAERHFVEAGPSWRTKVPPFRVLVHSPSKRTSTLSGAYTVYTVTTAFAALSHSRQASDSSDLETDPDAEPPSPMRITVHRRFSHFVALHTALSRHLPGVALPPLPEKQYAGRFSEDFVEARRGDLERYINRVIRHPIARYAEVLTFFLGCESDVVRSRVDRRPYAPRTHLHVGVEEATSALPLVAAEGPVVLCERLSPCIQCRRR